LCIYKWCIKDYTLLAHYSLGPGKVGVPQSILHEKQRQGVDEIDGWMGGWMDGWMEALIVSNP